MAETDEPIHGTLLINHQPDTLMNRLYTLLALTRQRLAPILQPALTFARKQADNRVYWLVGALVIASFLVFAENQLGEQNMNALGGQYAAKGPNPTELLQQWRHTPDLIGQWQLALLEMLLDMFLFIPAYVGTLLIWCGYYTEHSLFVTNPRRPRLTRLMRGLGQAVMLGTLVGAAADVVENLVLIGWLFDWPVGWVSSGLLSVIRVTKMAPIALALWYILLHPLGILLSFREAFLRLFGIDQYDQEPIRLGLLHHIDQHRQNEAAVNQHLRTLEPPQPTPLTFRRYFRTIWRGFLNVQFIVYLLLLLFGLLQLDQFDELFYSLINNDGKSRFWVLLFSLVSLGLLGGMVYVSSKLLLFVQPNYFGQFSPDQPADSAAKLLALQPELRLLRNVPLWLAHAPFVIMALTLILNYGRLNALMGEQTANAGLAYITLLMAVIASGLVFYWILRPYHQSLDAQHIALFEPLNPSHDYALLVDLAPRSILFGQGLLVATLMVFLPTVTGLPAAQTIGLYAMVCLWLAAVAYLGTLIYQFNNLPDFPLIVILVGLVLLFSRYNDNSDIRLSIPSGPNTAITAPCNVPAAQTPSLDSSLALQRPDIAAYYRQWLETRLQGDTTSQLPVIVIATAGGGIRAAAWTTEALSALNDSIPCFDRHLFAISGVSGGGVGAATYVATLAGHRDSLTCQPRHDAASLKKPVQRVITEDLISPTAAAMLFRGGVHNLMPVVVPALDRNRWLEDAWERGMLSDSVRLDSTTHQVLPQSFLRLWPSNAELKGNPLALPALLLNGAAAETGQKVVMTNLNLGNTTDSLNPFYDVADLFASIRSDVPYKTATFLCARFPFVTSGGKATGPLPNITGATCRQTSYHVIDGGYAENTGILTAVQLIKSLQRISDTIRIGTTRRPVARQVRYFLIFLPNYAAADTPGTLSTLRFLAEPVKGFLNTWNRNSVGLDQLIANTLSKDLSFNYTSLTLDTRRHHYPLGWYISKPAVEKMSEQVRADIHAGLNERQASVLCQIKTLLTSSFCPVSTPSQRPKSIPQTFGAGLGKPIKKS